MKRIRDFVNSDLGDLLLHVAGGVLGGVLGLLFQWWLVIVIWAAFFGRELGQHEDEIGRVFTRRQVLLEAHLPLIVGLLILFIFGKSF